MTIKNIVKILDLTTLTKFLDPRMPLQILVLSNFRHGKDNDDTITNVVFPVLIPQLPFAYWWIFSFGLIQ